MAEADCQRGVTLAIFGIVVDVLVQQVQDGEEEFFLASVVEGGFLVHVDHVKID